MREIVGINSEPEPNPSTPPTENKRQNFIPKKSIKRIQDTGPDFKITILKKTSVPFTAISFLQPA